jgi:acyl carrier protein
MEKKIIHTFKKLFVTGNHDVRRVAGVLRVKEDTLRMDSNYENTKNWDSLGMVNIIVALEERFDINIELEDAEQFISVKNIISILRKKYL